MNAPLFLCRTLVIAVAMCCPLFVQAQIAPMSFEEIMSGLPDFLKSVDPPHDSVPEGVELPALTLEHCVEQALQNNEELLQSIEDQAIREAQAGQARSGRKPTLTGEAAYTYVEGMPQSVGNPLLESFIGSGTFTSEKGQTNMFLRLEQVLYAGGQINNAVRAAESLATAEGWRYQVTRAQIEAATRTAYYNALLANALVTVARASIDAFSRHAKDAQTLLDAGVATQFDVLRAQTELGAQESALENAQSNLEIALLNLKRLMAMPVATPIRLEGLVAWPEVNEPLDACVAQALQYRPEIQALEGARAAAEYTLEARKGLYKPKVAVSAEYNDNRGGGTLVPEGMTYNAGVQWKLYDGGMRKHQRLEAKAQLRRTELEAQALLNTVELDVRTAYRRLQEAVVQIRTETKTLELAEEGVRMARIRFQEGIGTQTETIDAQLSDIQAQTALVQAMRNYGVAAAELQRAIGTPSAPSLNGEPESATQPE
ncbi:MAG: TolC family protein [Candidatus Hydrogenedentes bacterium]|nr:TolC family protein [Candidatus Hydrogenedentota bacterium]